MAQGAGAKKILIVDDESAILQTLRFNLERNGYLVATAGDGRSAVALASSERPDLVIMDIRLASETDGIAAALEILDRTGIRCIFATAYADAATRERGEKARPFGWLHKPFTADVLLGAVKAALESRDD